MSLSKETIQELRKRLEAVHSERTELESRVEDLDTESIEIEAILERHGPPEPVAKKKQPRRSQGRSVWVKQLLESLERVVSPSEVAAAMTDAGYPWDNGVDRIGIVATDLHRLSQAKNGEVKRVKRGGYRYVGSGGAS